MKTLNIELKKIIFNYLNANTIATIEDLSIMYEKFGANWNRISDTIELLNKGYGVKIACKEIERKMILTSDRNEINAQVRFKMNEFMI